MKLITRARCMAQVATAKPKWLFIKPRQPVVLVSREGEQMMPRKTVSSEGGLEIKSVPSAPAGVGLPRGVSVPPCCCCPHMVREMGKSSWGLSALKQLPSGEW